ncbi:bifunctional aminoglycoside phosphotransferase/ATP-binding protein [Thiothrix lacustris]|uniref:bifunctional aminoglycoside phosphotransferase/ATP-binding protein n=1 Tax=Thiothrix lacustris TaxID=525917 RepID=UPI0027E4F361|nr:AAA family ATPase [Thiothrix lacustris]WMP16481.1 AAA family ATPase [Thiothrix lacustris]
MSSHTSDTLWEAMRNPAFYPHTTYNIQVIHTHISTVFLTGKFAYKIKKPVNFGFLDFSQLADRQHFCQEELRLNRRFAPKLYLDVVPILLVDGLYQLGSTTAKTSQNIVEYAVKMRQFDPSQQLDCLLSANLLPLEWMDELATRLAQFHQQADIAPTNREWGLPENIFSPMQQNFISLRQHLHEEDLLEQLAPLEHWTQQTYSQQYDQLLYRQKNGGIRACHGDLHLGNIALIDAEITFFDGIEFNEALRWIDTASDIAFLLMDLDDRSKPAWAHRLLNAWLAESGDYATLPLLNFYQVYRAMVRAKVHALRLSQLEDAAERSASLQQCARYLTLAESYTHTRQPKLLITHGLSGSGKSWACRQVVEQLGCIQLRSDVERKRHYSGSEQHLYSADMNARTYDRLAELTTLALHSGYSVVVDATFLQQEQRQRFQQLANDKQVAFLILHFEATPAQLESNILQRQQAGNDASDADIAVLHQQLTHYKPLQDNEPYVTVRFNEGLPLARIRILLDCSKKHGVEHAS